MQSDDVTATQDLLYEEMVSDDDYIVIDGKDVAKLVEELQQAGQDQLGDVRDSSSGDEDRLSHDFLTLAEKRSDEWNGRTVVQPVEQETGGGLDEEKGAQTQREELTGSGEDAEKPVGMDYFIDDHVQYMPSWAAEAYQSGEHRDLEHAAMRLNPTSTGQRLHDIVARKKLVGIESLKDVQSGRDGIVDCTVEDVAEDYSVPLEFVVDAMIHYGVPVPISGNQSIRDSMTREEIERLLNLITSFDAVDLSDRYSDRTINELAEVYEISVDAILDVCQKEALYLCSAETTRLSIVREDRVLDIILKGGATGKPYPSLLDGLEK
ncbi:unnamed protein product [Chondrus crispus]|uniref:Uncharacterized protein n=1 Tax=Chondrus crispus TaxID=2769 RepID=R7Q6X6_CHOCR|nr:unnamed protein product [Chondrus crispus]CDF34287.1 unnamed protein product [Chondrus crispus]|eukprot:XP_005714106.1 unnamed protein product [Chondrus crispus]